MICALLNPRSAPAYTPALKQLKEVIPRRDNGIA